MLIISMLEAVVPAFATEKEEVVYAGAGCTGTEVDGVYLVNTFEGGDIQDYGNYTSVHALNTEVQSVQFVITTPSIHVEEEKTVAEETETSTTILDRIRDLFK